MADMFADDPEMKLDTLLSNVDARWEHRFSSTDCGASADMGASSTRTLSEQGVAKRARVDTGNDLSMDDSFLRSLPLGSSRHLSNPRPISSGGCASNSYDESIVGVCETTNHRAGFFRKLRTNGRVLTFFGLSLRYCCRYKPLQAFAQTLKLNDLFLNLHSSHYIPKYALKILNSKP
jgi:hypothetical protein